MSCSKYLHNIELTVNLFTSQVIVGTNIEFKNILSNKFFVSKFEQIKALSIIDFYK